MALAVDNDVKAARLVKGRLEKTTLNQVARHIKIVLKPGKGTAGPGGQGDPMAIEPGGAGAAGGAYGGGPRIHGEVVISIRLDMNAIEALQLDVDGHTVRGMRRVGGAGGFASACSCVFMYAICVVLWCGCVRARVSVGGLRDPPKGAHGAASPRRS